MKQPQTLSRAGGFTLVEVMIVVAIIGVLAAIAIPQYRLFVLQAKRTEAIQLTRGVATAEYSYAATYENYPATSGFLSAFATVLDFDMGNIKFYPTQLLYGCDVICPAAPPPCDSFNVVVSGDLDNNTVEPFPFDVVVYQHSGDTPGGSLTCPPMLPTTPLDMPWVLVSDL